MKRFYKFLMPIVAIVAMAFSLNLSAQTTCSLTIVGEDAYGDAWNGGELSIVQNGTVVATFDAANADNDGNGPIQDTLVVTLQSGVHVDFLWSSGSYDDEVTIWVYNSDGDTLYEVNEPPAGALFSMCDPCGSVIVYPVAGLTAQAAENDGDVALAWESGSFDSYQVAWGLGEIDPDTALVNYSTTTTTSFTITGLETGVYYFYVRGDFGDGCYSAWSATSISLGAIVMNMATSGSDTIRTCLATIYDDGGPDGSYSSSISLSTLVIYPSDDQHLVSVSGSSYTESTYDYLTIYDGVGTDGNVLFTDYSNVSMLQNFGPFYSDAITVTFHSDGSVTYDGFQIDVACVEAPSCPRPGNITLTDVQTDEFTIAWTDDNNSSWTVYYGPEGFDPSDDDANMVTVNTTSVNITNLTPNTLYEVYVYGNCSGELSLPRTTVVRTLCVPLTAEDLPYSYGFEGTSTGSSAEIDACWTKGTNYSTAYPYPSSSNAVSGNRTLYFYAYSNYYCYVALPRYVDSVNTLQLTFWSMSSSTSYLGNLTAGVMTDPTDISTFVPIQVCIPDGSNMTYFEVNFNEYHGQGEYIALLCDVQPGASSNYVYLDDVTIRPLPTCGHVENFRVLATTTATSMLTWEESTLGEISGYEFQYMVDTVADWEDAQSETVDGTSILLEGLDPATGYLARVRTLCDNDDVSEWEYASFHTTSFVCNEMDTSMIDTVEFSNSTTGTSGCIANSAWGNTVYQTIYTADELTAAGLSAGPITAIDLGFTAASSYSKELTIFMGNTGTTYINDANMENPNQMVQVYGPAPHPAGTDGWQHYEFANTFVWDGSSSIILTTFMNQPSGESHSSSSGLTGYYVSAPNTSRYRYQDSSPFTLSNYNGGNAASNYSYRAAIHFYSGECTNFSSCAAPGVWVENVTSDSVTIGIIPGSDESEWDIYLQMGNGEMTYVESTSEALYSLANLNSASMYTVRVKSVCDDSVATDVNFTTQCGQIRALPIVQDFENEVASSSNTGSAFANCWTRLNNGTSYGGYPYVYNSTTYNHTDGGTKGLYWYNATTTGTYGDYQIVVLPQLDTNALPINTTMLTFWAKSSSTSYDPTFYVGFLSSLDSIDNFVYYDTIYVGNNTNWTKFTVMFDRYDNAANCSYIAIRANRPSSSWYAYVDDIVLDSIPNCSPIEDLTVKAGPVSAIMQWTTMGSNYTGATIRYRLADDTEWDEVVVNDDMYAVLTGLTPDTTYVVRVSAICDDESSISLNSTFKTRQFPCNSFDENNYIDTTIGVGATTSSYLPTYSFYNYSYSEQIFTPEEVGGAGMISKITVYPSAVVVQRNIEVYLGTTDQTSVANNFINPSDITLVYNGPVQLVAGEPLEFNLTTPFDYDGSSNLVVAFRDMTGSYTSGNTFLADNGPSGCARYVYTDNGAYTIGAVTGGSSTNVRNKISIYGGVCLATSTCAAPRAMVTDVTTNSVEVRWAPGNTETQWVVYYRLAGDDNYTFVDTANTNSYTFTNLMSGTNYEFKVEGVCTDVYADEVNAVTLCAEINTFPYTEDFNSWGSGSGVLPNCWYRSGSYSSYTYISPSANHSGNNGGAIYMYSSTSETYQSNLIMPAIDTNAVSMNQLQVVFHSIFTSTSYAGPVIQVGVVSDPMDFNTFEPVDTVYSNGYVNEWDVYEVSLANYVGEGTHVALRSVYPGAYTYFYIDDITLEMIPECQRPVDLQASNMTTSSVDLSWTDRAGATSWQIEYGPVGFTPGDGTGTVVTATSNPYTLLNMPASFQADFYVSALCNGVAGPASRVPGRISLQQIPATLPYDYDFETAGEWANWQTVSNVNNNFFRGTAVANNSNYSMYMSADFGATYTPYLNNWVVNAAAYRDVDFGTIDSSFTMTFDARVGGTIANSYDGLMVFLVDTAGIPESHSTNITSPWGNVNDLYRIATVRLDTVWQTYTCSFDTISGVKRVAFFWFNQNTLSSAAIQEPCAVDNIHIDYSSCPRPVATTVTGVGSTTASLTWTGITNANYEVIYRPYPDGDSNYVATSNTNSITLTGLDPVTQYAVWVRRVCSDDDASLESDGILFRTSLCENSFVAQNFDASMSTSTSSYSPLGYAFYNYSYVQMIVDSSRLAGMNGDITAFAFDPSTTTSSDYYNHMTVYMANVPESSLSGFIVPDETTHVFQEVITDRDLSFTETGYQIVGLDTTFTWDGHSNILVAFNRQHGDYESSTSFNAHVHSSNQMAYAYNDNNPYNVNNPTQSTVYTSATAGDLYLISCGTAGCPAPSAITFNNVSYNAATANWTADGTDFEVSYKEADENEWATEISVTNSASYTMTGLTPSTDYMFRVRVVCTDEETEETSYSEWLEGTFTTEDLPCFVPTALTATATTYTTATLDWTAGGVETQWQLHVWNHNLNPEFDTVLVTSSHPVTLGGLLQTTSYNAEVKSICGGGLDESEYSTSISFTTSSCAQVTGVTASGVLAHQATISWAGTASSYEIDYGGLNHSQGTGTTVVVTGNTYTITNLLDDSWYSVFVRAICEPGVYGPWSTQADFQTPEEGGNETYYTITANSATPSMGTVTGGGSYLEGSTATLTATPNQGYRFVQWQDGVTTNPRSVTVTADATYTAYFEAIPTYTITVQANDATMGTVTGSGVYEENSTVTISATPNQGYQFVQWSDGETAATRTITVTADATYTANFAPEGTELNYYDVTVSVNDPAMGSVQGGGTHIVEGSVITLTAVPNPGYRFVQWQDGNTDNPRQVTVTEDMSFTATFEALPEYTITVNVNDPTMGSVQGGGTYAEGTQVTLTAVPNQGYEFVQWQDGNAVNPRTITVTGDATYTATFRSSVGIADVESASLTIYPNPARESATIMLSGVSGEVTVTVVDMNGRTVGQYSTSSTDRLTLDLSGYAQGAYFVRVSGEGVNMVKKLIVK